MQENQIMINAELITAFSPAHCEVIDDSEEHLGHAGAANGGGHYRVLIVSKDFSGIPPIARHRKIYQVLGPWMGSVIHALQIGAYTPEEWAQRDRTS